ncbi:MAG TPA: hypothetical protein VN700_19630 [Vicinamibacterales bacterium]|nr:hypothetical protein [Vicinamibacterales bacterium]
MIKRFILLALLAVAPVLQAQTDLTGTWSGPFVMTVDGDTHDDTALMVLTQKGAELTGTAGPTAEQQWPILKGKVEGAAAEFDVQSDGPLVHFALKLVDGHLKGDAKAEMDGRKMSATVNLQRKPK